MKCPYCKKEMELGFIQSPQEISWKKGDKRPLLGRAQFHECSVILSELSYQPVADEHIVAVFIFFVDKLGIFKVVAPSLKRFSIKDIVMYDIDIDQNRVAEELTVFAVLGDEQWAIAFDLLAGHFKHLLFVDTVSET